MNPYNQPIFDPELKRHAEATIEEYWNRPDRVVLSSPRSDQSLVHYSSTTGCKGILESKSLWASAAIYLRDTSEITYGIELRDNVWFNLGFRSEPLLDICIKNAIQKNALAQSTAFILSFSTTAPNTPSSLLHWNDFGDSKSGAALIFPSDFLVTVSKEANKLNHQCGIGLVEYNKNKQVEKWCDLFEFYSKKVMEASKLFDHSQVVEVYSSLISSLLSMFTPFFKHPMLENETEARAVINVHETQYGSIKFRDRNGIRIPFIEVPIPVIANGLSPISHVYLGPSFEEAFRLESKAIARVDPQYTLLKVLDSGFPRHK